MPDKTLICKDCGEDFDFTEKEQQFFRKNSWNDPIRCKPCRDQRRQDRPKQDQQRS